MIWPPNSFRSSIKAFDANWGPQSDMILSGSPKHLYRFSNNSCAVSSVVIVFEHGIRIIPFVSPWSTTTRMESCPFTGGRSNEIHRTVCEGSSGGGSFLLEGRKVSLVVGQSWTVDMSHILERSSWHKSSVLATNNVVEWSYTFPILWDALLSGDHGTF